VAEGGAKNVAAATAWDAVLSAATYTGASRITISGSCSGTGAIDREANLRLIADGRFGSHKMK
jgi:hypothetical protein